MKRLLAVLLLVLIIQLHVNDETDLALGLYSNWQSNFTAVMNSQGTTDFSAELVDEKNIWSFNLRTFAIQADGAFVSAVLVCKGDNVVGVISSQLIGFSQSSPEFSSLAQLAPIESCDNIGYDPKQNDFLSRVCESKITIGGKGDYSHNGLFYLASIRTSEGRNLEYIDLSVARNDFEW